ncbi:MAG: hypothetical protein ACPL1Z_05790 [Candidatus Bathyarchaeales archaeon]
MAIKLDKAKLQTALEIFPKSDLTRINETIAKASESYTAGEEKVKLNLTNIHGHAEIVHDGDGDAGVTTRIYLDGATTPNETIAGNVFGIIIVSFTSSLAIRVYAAAAGTYNCSNMRVAGFRRSA